MNEHQAYLLVRIEAMTEADYRAADDVAGQLAAQAARRASRFRCWIRRFTGRPAALTRRDQARLA
jgi:hypothetical protein